MCEAHRTEKKNTTHQFKPPQKERPPQHALHVLPMQTQVYAGDSAGCMREVHLLDQLIELHLTRSKGLREPAGNDGCSCDEVAEEGVYRRCSRLVSEA